MTDEYDYSDIKRETVGSKDNILAQLTAAAMDQLTAEKEVAVCEEALAVAKAALKRISEFTIPELMDAAETQEHTTKDGLKIKISETIRGSIPKENPDPAFKWLADNKHDDLIKREFNIRFGKGDEAWAKKFEADLKKRKKPVAVEVKRTVHASTLASFVKSQLEAGVDFPLDTFGVFRQRVSKVEQK
jgi:hypothetical protein